MILNTLGWILVFESIFLLVPSITAAVYAEWSYLIIYFAVAVLCFAIGFPIARKKPLNRKLYARDGYVIVALSWITISLFGALPLFISGDIPDYIDALFETVSGFTTTGSTILSDVEVLSKSSLMWRSFQHWVGGMGVLVFITAFLPLSGATNMHIIKAESTGPSVGKLVPRVKTTSLLLYSIYFALTSAQFIALLIAGMPVFDALNTAFATAGTGGFGIKNTSLGEYSPAIQMITAVFMVLFSINFNSYFTLLRGKIKGVFTTEVLTFLFLVGASTAVIAFDIRDLFETGDAIRNSFFTVSAIISSTGFATQDFNLWPELSRSILVMLMFVGACAGSTGGGIKVARILILFKGFAKEIKGAIHPRQVKKIKMGDRPVEHEVVRSVNAYMVSYTLIFVISLLIISFDNHDLITNFTSVTTALNNIGPGLELVGPTANFSFFSYPAKLVLIFDMLAGRLELFPMLLLLSPNTWKK